MYLSRDVWRIGGTRGSTRVAVAVAMAAVALGGGWFWWGERGSDDARHVILVIADTTRRDSLGCYGSDRQITPSLDSIAAEGVRFERAIAQSCWTLPAVTSILTSTYPTIHGALGREMLFGRCREEIPHGQEILRTRGFKTKAIVNAAFLGPKLGTRRGFDDFDYVEGRNWEIRRADKSVDAAIEFYEKNRRRDTFVLLHLFDPHLNYDPPAEFRERFAAGYSGPYTTITDLQISHLVGGSIVPDQPEREYLLALHQAETAFMDREIGRLVERLKGLGIYDQTTMVIVADHGEEFWDHGKFEHGHSMYAELIGVPLIIKPPVSAGVASGIVSTRVRQIDIMPTILELAGIDRPETFEGESLVSLMRGVSGSGHRVAYSEGTLYDQDETALYRGNHKYIYDARDGSGELYDVEADPQERENLVTRLPEVAREMRRELAEMCNELAARSAGMSVPEAVDVRQIPELQEQLDALGYTSREGSDSTDTSEVRSRCPDAE